MRRYSPSLLVVAVLVIATPWILSRTVENSVGQFQSAVDNSSMPNIRKSQDEQIKRLEEQIARLTNKVAVLEVKNGIVDGARGNLLVEQEVNVRTYKLAEPNSEQIVDELNKVFQNGILAGQIAIYSEKGSNSIVVAGRNVDQSTVKKAIKRFEEKASEEKEKLQELKIEIDEKSRGRK